MCEISCSRSAAYSAGSPRRACLGLELELGLARRGHGRQQGRIVAAGLVLVRVQAGDERRQRRAAQGGGHVAAGEHGAAFGERVEIRRFDVRVSHEAIVGPSVIVGDDEHDVGPLGVGGQGGQGSQQAEHEREQ